MEREKKPITEITPPTYPNRKDSRGFDRRSFLLAIGGSTAASVLFACNKKAPENEDNPTHRLPGKIAMPEDRPPTDTSARADTASPLEAADTGTPKDTAPENLYIAIPGLEVWSSEDEPKLKGRPLRLLDGTRVSFALIFESTNPAAKQFLQQKRGTLIHITDSYLRDKCEYSSVATPRARLRLAERLKKMFDKTLDNEKISLSEIRFMHVQREIRKKGVAPPAIHGLEAL